jgi:hypothetical protein
MKIQFFWKPQFGKIIPFCDLVGVNEDSVSSLVCLLLDDGGQNYLDTIPWLEEGLNRLEAMKKNKVMTYWSREAWGAELTEKEVKIYSLHDESYFQICSLDSFRKVLSSWIIFIKSNHDVNSSQVIEI